MIKKLRQILAIVLAHLGIVTALGGASVTAMAMDLSLGLTAVESGNDTFRPGATVRVGVGKVAVADYTILGRTIGPVTERTSIFSLGGRWAVGSGNLYVTAGLSGAQEITRIKGGSQEGGDLTEVSLAGGGALGVGYTLLRAAGYRMDLSWTSHIYPAGGGGLLLAHGRKQLFGLTAGVDL